MKFNIGRYIGLLKDPLLFAGCRNGTCYIWDTRHGVSPVASITEPPTGTRACPSIIGLHPFHDHNYFITNALNSKVSFTYLTSFPSQPKIIKCSCHSGI